MKTLELSSLGEQKQLALLINERIKELVGAEKAKDNNKDTIHEDKPKDGDDMMNFQEVYVKEKLYLKQVDRIQKTHEQQ